MQNTYSGLLNGMPKSEDEALNELNRWIKKIKKGISKAELLSDGSSDDSQPIESDSTTQVVAHERSREEVNTVSPVSLITLDETRHDTNHTAYQPELTLPANTVGDTRKNFDNSNVKIDIRRGTPSGSRVVLLALIDQNSESRCNFFGNGKVTLTQETLLGNGSYGKVYKYINKETGAVAAGKKFDNKFYDVDVIAREYAFLCLCSGCKWVVGHIGLAVNKSEQIAVIFMDYHENGTLENYVRNNKEKIKKDPSLQNKWAKQMWEGVSFIHKHYVLHRDIKPSNVMVTKDLSLVYIDLGTADVMGNEKEKQTSVGTPAYQSPEARNGYYDTCSDYWAVRCVELFVSSFGMHPWNGCTSPDVIKRIRNIGQKTSSMKSELPYPGFFTPVPNRTFWRTENNRIYVHLRGKLNPGETRQEDDTTNCC